MADIPSTEVSNGLCSTKPTLTMSRAAMKETAPRQGRAHVVLSKGYGAILRVEPGNWNLSASNTQGINTCSGLFLLTKRSGNTDLIL